MPLQAPNLDDRTYEQLKRAALLRIPRYTPEWNPHWNDYNESDPGIALVDLFAWFTEMMLYRLNKVPDSSYLKFLQLLGLNLQPPEAARATLVMTPRAGTDVNPVPQRTRVSAQSDAGEALVFETMRGLDLIRLPLAKVQVFDGAGFTEVTAINATPGSGFWPFGWLPQAGNALYLGFGPAAPAPNPPAAKPPFFPAVMSFHVFLPQSVQATRPAACQGATLPVAPPAELAWEYRPAGAPGRWRSLSTWEDASLALTREGAIQVEGPAQDDLVPTIEGVVAEPCYWLRLRLVSGGYPAGVAPRLDFLAVNAVEVENLATVNAEPLGTSDAAPSQVFTLRHSPVVADSLKLLVQEDGAPNADAWTQKPDFLASAPDDPHYTLDAVTGQVRFGDGRRGRIPPARTLITALEYRFGGGVGGNVQAGAISALLTNNVGIDRVANPRPAVGGRDEQQVADFLQLAPAQLRCVDRAVSADDFTTLARQVGGIARAVALPLFHPDHRDVDVAGAITVVVVPDTLDIPPAPSQQQLDVVCDYLHSRRMLTTELYVKGPEFFAVRVEARVAANPYAAAGKVAQAVGDAINAYLDPLAGSSRLRRASAAGRADSTPALPTPALPTPAGPTVAQAGHGSDFGQDLYPTHLYAVILAVPDVRQVRYLAVSVNGQPWAIEQRVPIPKDGMVYGVQDHDISVEPYQDL